MRKPVVIYVEESTDRFGNGNIDKQTLDSYFKNESGVDVVSYENFWRLEADYQRVARLMKQEILALIIFKESRWDNDHCSNLAFVRSKISDKVLVWLQREYISDFPFKNKDNDRNILYGKDEEILKKINEHLKNWQVPDTWLGVESEYEERLLMERLEKAYDRWHDEENLLAAPDYNHKVVAEALRLRLLPSEFIGEHLGEFDQDVLLSIQGLVISPNFDLEVEKIRQIDNEQRDSFLELLSKRRNSPDGISWGRNVMGFAIDPLTLEVEINNNYGQHAYATDHLSYRLDRIANLSGKYLHHDGFCQDALYDYRSYCLSRILPGLIFKKIEGFETPILKLFTKQSCVSEEYLNKALRHLMQKKKYIPVNTRGEILDGTG